MSKRRIVVTGGRDYRDWEKVSDTLDMLAPEEVFVGDCPTGVDHMVRIWCEDVGLKPEVFRADWGAFGNYAGPKRNGEMLKAATTTALLIAFEGGKGTSDCVRQAAALNFIVLEVKS